MSEVVTPLISQLGIGAVGGFIVGFALKKITKIILVIILALVVLVASGLLVLNFGRLFDAASGLLGSPGEALVWLTAIIAHLPFTGSFLVGLFLGWKFG